MPAASRAEWAGTEGLCGISDLLKTNARSLMMDIMRGARRIVKNERSFYIRDVPRVSEAHLTARREQILDAARRCFQRNGFHATSMQDVIAEAGLSVGAVYRYFRSKNELIAAIADQYASGINEQLGALAAAPGRSLLEVMEAAVDVMESNSGPDGAMRLAVPLWAEALRDDGVAATVDGLFHTVRGSFVEIARRAVAAGDLPAETDPAATGTALYSLLAGYGVQRLLTGHPTPRVYKRALAALLAPR
jgi:AcrR family transcriptional regulator